MRFITNVPVDEFIALLKVAACLVGNSSAGIKECSYLGTPVVEHRRAAAGAAARRQRRARPATTRAAILAAVARQIAHGRYAPSHIYYRAGASQTIVDVLAGAELYTQKRFCENGAKPP